MTDLHGWWKALRARPRLSFSVLLIGIVYGAMPESFIKEPLTRALLAWNVGVTVYLALILSLMLRIPIQELARRAIEQQVGQVAVLVISVVAVGFSLSGVVFELTAAKALLGHLKAEHICLAIATVITAWVFMQVMFAQHYAHEYHEAIVLGRPGGLDFPGDEVPDYGDFLYFALVIGACGQTADVSFTSRALRRIGTVHCLLAFVFNTTLVALTINIASGLF